MQYHYCKINSEATFTVVTDVLFVASSATYLPCIGFTGIRLLFISVPSRKSWSSGCPTASWQPHLLRSSWWITTGGMSLKENLPVWGHVHHLLDFSMSCIWEEKILNPRYDFHIGPDARLWYHHVLGRLGCLGRLGTCLTLRDRPSISAKWSTFDEPIELTTETGIKRCLKSGDSLTRDQGIP